MVAIAGKGTCHCGVGIVLYVKDMVLEPISGYISSLFSIFNAAPLALQAVNETFVLAGAIVDGVVGFLL